MIKIKNYSLEDLILSRGIIASFIEKFWNEEFALIEKKSNDHHLMLLVKVQFTDNSEGYRTLGHLRRVNFEDRDQFIEYLTERLSILSDSYTTLSVKNIVFTYIIRDGLASGTLALLKNVEE